MADALPSAGGASSASDADAALLEMCAGPRFAESRIVVGIALRNGKRTVRPALESALLQACGPSELGVLLLDDQSDDDWREEVEDLLASPRVAVARTRCGAAWKARNALLELAERLCPRLQWHARLDADDLLLGSGAVAGLLAAVDGPGVLAVVGSNRQRQAGRLLPAANLATTELLDSECLFRRLEGMARQSPSAELPSCNLLLRARAGFRYPAEQSAEDHWLVARLLLCHRPQVRVQPRTLYCDYSLDGAATASNRRSEGYLASRVRLLESAREWGR